MLQKIASSIFHRSPPASSIVSQERRQRLFDVADKVLSDQSPNAIDTWQQFLAQVSSRIKSEDLNRFLVWPEIKASMFVSNQRFVRSELYTLKSLPDWKDRWFPATRETNFGSPRVFVKDPGSSGNLIHHSYLVSRIENVLGQKVTNFDSVFEFGGGYGNMAKLFGQLGFKGDYFIYDFELFSAIQNWYLTSLGYRVENSILLNDEDADHVIHCLSGDLDSEGLGAQLKSSNCLFLATWSLSETSIEYRSAFEKFISTFDSVAIAYQEQIEVIDNVQYFNDLSKKLTEFDWTIEPLVFQPKNALILGKRKNTVDSVC